MTNTQTNTYVPYKVGMPKDHVDTILKKTGRKELMKPKMVFDDKNNPLGVRWHLQDATLTLIMRHKKWFVAAINLPVKDLPIHNPVVQ